MTGLANNLDTLSPEARDFLFNREHGPFVGGAPLCGASSGANVVDPSSGKVVAAVRDATQADVSNAVEAARAVLGNGAWGRLRPYQRADCLFALADAIERSGTAIAEMEVVNSGRLIGATRGLDVDFSAHLLRYFAGWCTKIAGKTLDLSVPYIPDAEFSASTTMEPVGVVAGIVPWNVPLGLASFKVGAALAAGCSIILKPSPQTPFTALWLAELCNAIGMPQGTLNVLTGAEAGQWLVDHPGVDKVSFTGSTEVGRKIASSAGRMLKKVTLELGGKSPVVVMPDADLDLAIPAAAWAIFGNHGQNCCAGSRLLVHRSLFDKVIRGVVEIAEAIRIGPGLDPTSQMGPLASERQQATVLRYVEDAVRGGASLATGGEGLPGPGYYVKPSVLVDVRPEMSAVREEIFGPVLVAMPFDDGDEALRIANDTEFGLGASIFTRDIDTAHKFIKGVKAGTVWVNVHNVLDAALPFGGLKASGIGHDLGEEAVKAHLNIKAAVFRHGG